MYGWLRAAQRACCLSPGVMSRKGLSCEVILLLFEFLLLSKQAELPRPRPTKLLLQLSRPPLQEAMWIFQVQQSLMEPMLVELELET